MSEGMNYERAHVGCPQCWDKANDESIEMVWGFSLSEGNLIFCPACNFKVPQHRFDAICFNPDGDIHIEALQMWLTSL